MENITVVLVLVHFLVSLLMVIPSTAAHMRALFESKPDVSHTKQAQAHSQKHLNLPFGGGGLHQKYSGDQHLWILSLVVCGAILVVEQRRVMRVLGM